MVSNVLRYFESFRRRHPIASDVETHPEPSYTNQRRADAEWNRFQQAYFLARSDPIPRILFEASQRYHNLIAQGAPPEEVEGAKQALKSYWDEWGSNAVRYINNGKELYFGEEPNSHHSEDGEESSKGKA